MIVTGTRIPAERHQAAAPPIDDQGLNEAIKGILNRWPAVGLAVGVVRNGRLDFFHGHGLADIASNTPVTEDTVFRIASVTKTFTAIAVMQLCEQGLIDLDTPANHYLRAFRLIPAEARWRPATVRHLLTHTAGIPQVARPWYALRHLSGITAGESFAMEEPLPTLGEYYRGGIRLVAEPGTRFTYSDHGFATLGQIVEDVSKEPLDQYLRERIFEPLGMADTDLLRSERLEARLATGYRVSSDGPEEITDRTWVTAAAASIYSTPRDMARYLAFLLDGADTPHGRVLQPETLATMFAAHFRPDPRVAGMGLGFFRFDLGGHLAVEHQGILPGFNSQIFVAPDDGVAVMAFTNGAPRALLWLVPETARLLTRLIGAREEAIRTDLPHHPEIWSDICGLYEPFAAAAETRERAMVGWGAEVLVRRGQLVVRALSPLPVLYRGFTLHPDDPSDPYVFRIDLTELGLGTGRIIFGQAPGGGTNALHLESALVSLHKRPERRNARRWGAGLGALAVGAALRRRHTRTRTRPS